MNYTLEQQTLLNNLLSKNFAQIEDDYDDRKDHWIDLVNGDFGADFLRQAVQAEDLDILHFFSTVGWDSATTLYVTSPSHTVNYTLGSLALLDGSLEWIQELYATQWLTGAEIFSSLRRRPARMVAILSQSDDVAEWLIDRELQSTTPEIEKFWYSLTEKESFLVSLREMNTTVELLIQNDVMQVGDKAWTRYSNFIQRLLEDKLQCDGAEIFKQLLEQLPVIRPQERITLINCSQIFSKEFCQLMSNHPLLFDRSNHDVWNTLLSKNPLAWFSITHIPVDQIEKQKDSMWDQARVQAQKNIGFPKYPLQRWIEHAAQTDRDFFNRFPPTIQNLISPTPGVISKDDFIEACKNMRMVLETQPFYQKASTPPRKI